jgi:hypothetical protein
VFSGGRPLRWPHLNKVGDFPSVPLIGAVIRGICRLRMNLRQNLLFVIAASAELILDALMVVNAIIKNPVAIGGAVVRFAFMLIFALVGLSGRVWGRWCFIILSGLTACTTLLFSLVALEDGAHFSFNPSVLLISIVYLAITTLASIDTAGVYRRKKTEG